MWTAVAPIDVVHACSQADAGRCAVRAGSLRVVAPDVDSRRPQRRSTNCLWTYVDTDDVWLQEPPKRRRTVDSGDE
jgi:hypothetical protein